MKPEHLTPPPNSQHINDGSSIFAGKNEDQLNLLPTQKAENYPDHALLQEVEPLPPSDFKSVRLMLISHMGLLQDDVAKKLDISLYSLESSKVKPEQVSLKPQEKKVLLSSEIGKIILSRQDYRKQQVQEEKALELKTKLEEEARRQEEIIKRRVATRRVRARNREHKARQRGERIRRQSQLEIQIQASAINRKRLTHIETRRQEIEENSSALDSLSEDEHFALSKIAVPAKSIAVETGFSNTYFIKRRKSLMDRLGVDNKINLARWAYNHGVEYELPVFPNLDTFTLRERQVSLHLEKKNEDIANVLGISIHMLRADLESLFGKTGARSREELALISEANYFQPLPEELQQDTPHELLKDLTPYQREVVARIYLPSPLIAEELGKNDGAIMETVKRCLKVLGMDTSMQLAKKLLDSGYEFEGIKKISKPLHEVLPQDQLDVVRLVNLTNHEIAEHLDIDHDKAKSLVSRARRTLYARSRIELMAMVSRHDTGENIIEETKTRRELFFESVGLEQQASPQLLRDLLSSTTPHQRRSIVAYFFSESEQSWNDIGKKFGVSYSVARRNAYRGLDNIKAAIEEKNIKEMDPDYIHHQKAKLLTLLGINLDEFDMDWIRKEIPKDEIKFVEDYYLSGKTTSWSIVANAHNVSSTKARETAGKVIKSLQEKLTKNSSQDCL